MSGGVSECADMLGIQKDVVGSLQGQLEASQVPTISKLQERIIGMQMHHWSCAHGSTHVQCTLGAQYYHVDGDLQEYNALAPPCTHSGHGWGAPGASQTMPGGLLTPDLSVRSGRNLSSEVFWLLP